MSASGTGRELVVVEVPAGLPVSAPGVRGWVAVADGAWGGTNGCVVQGRRVLRASRIWGGALFASGPALGVNESLLRGRPGGMGADAAVEGRAF